MRHACFYSAATERHCASAGSNFWPTEGRRLSWLGWLGEILKWFTRPKTVTHPSTSRGGGESNSRPLSRMSDALSTDNALLYRKHRNSQFTCQLRSLVTIIRNWKIALSRINARGTILLKILWSSVYLVIDYIGSGDICGKREVPYFRCGHQFSGLGFVSLGPFHCA